MFVVGSAAVLVQCVTALVRARTRREPETAALAAAGTVLVLGALWSLQAFNGWPDNFFALPSAALGVGGLVAALRSLVSPQVARGAAVAWIAAATALSLAFSIGERNDTLDEQRVDVAAAMRLLPPGARILSVSAPQPLVLAHERNLTRLQIFSNGITPYLDDSWPGGRDGYARWIARRSPAVIAIGSSPPAGVAAPHARRDVPVRGRVARLGLVRPHGPGTVHAAGADRGALRRDVQQRRRHRGPLTGQAPS